MAEESFLSDEFLSQIMAAGEVDVLVGVPTLNNGKTVERVIHALQVGLAKYFPRARAALINPDGGSKDGTPEIVRHTSVSDFRTLLASNPLRTTHTLTTSCPVMLGKAGAFRIIFAAADLLRAKACAIVSPDSETITPEWVNSLIWPIYRESFDFLAPVYQRHKFDGLLIKQILSPLISATYGYEVEEPLGPEFGFSGRLACHYLNQDVWRQDFMRFGAEIWLTTTAMLGDYRLCQSFLGPKVHSAKSTDSDLAGTIQQIIGALFTCLEIHEAAWASRKEVQVLPVFGFSYDMDLQPLRVNRKRMLQVFRSGVEQLASVLEVILSQGTLQGIREITKLEDEAFYFSDELWVRTVAEFAGSYHRSVINRDHILQALTPLYLGRIASLLLQNRDDRTKEMMEKLKALYTQYQSSKSYLIERWNAKA